MVGVVHYDGECGICSNELVTAQDADDITEALLSGKKTVVIASQYNLMWRDVRHHAQCLRDSRPQDLRS